MGSCNSKSQRTEKPAPSASEPVSVFSFSKSFARNVTLDGPRRVRFNSAPDISEGVCFVDVDASCTSNVLELTLRYDYQPGTIVNPLLGACIGTGSPASLESRFYEKGFVVYNLYHGYLYQEGCLTAYHDTEKLNHEEAKQSLFLLEETDSPRLLYSGEWKPDYLPCVAFAYAPTISESFSIL